MMKSQLAVLATIWTYMIVMEAAFITGVESLRKANPCPCPDKNACARRVREFNETEAVVVATATTEYSEWKWDSLSTVVMNNRNLLFDAMMCYTISRGAKYGFIEEFPNQLNSTELEKWTQAILAAARRYYVQVIVLDLIKYVSPCHNMHNASDQTKYDLAAGVNNVTTKIKSQGIKVMCLLPWKPPCYGTDCEFVSEIAHNCDAIITSPESYTTSCTMTCKARATVPFSKLVVGTDEYLSYIPSKKLMIGIPWHGYDYTCSRFDSSAHICKLPTNNATNTCDHQSARHKLTLGVMLKEFADHLASNSSLLDLAYKAPHYDYLDKATQKYHQVWYENLDSLHIKYRFAKDVSVGGVVIWTADDMHTTGTLTHPTFKVQMWSWLLHDMMRQGDISFHPSYGMVWAGNMAGIGVGCFVFGSLLGLAIGFMMFRRIAVIKRPTPPPFSQDDHEVEEYHDDDNTL